MPKSSVATRVAYAVLFLLTSILAWTMQTGWIDNMLSSIPPGPQNPYDCPEKNCFSGNFAVARVLFSLSIFHILFGLIMLGVRNSKDFRAGIQNGWWGPKMVLLVGMIVASFFIPDSFFHSYSVLAFIGATFFIFIQLVLLIDFAANWSESWVRKWEDSGSKGWMVLLIGTGVSLGVLILVGTILFYVFFGRRGCSLNIFYITFNLLLSALAFALSINGRVQEARPSSGILQAGVVSLYATYLLGSALTSEGDERCNPFSEGGQQAATVFGTLFTFVAIAYSTSRAATRSNVLMGENTAPPETVFDGGIKDLEAAAPLLVNEAPAPTASMERSSEMAQQQATAPTPTPATATTTTSSSSSSSIPAAPKSADQELIEIGMAPDTSDKRRRLEEAVAAGSLPKSALEEDEDEDEAEEAEGGRKALSREDERSGCNYNYSFYHAIFAVAAMYVTMLINKWSTVNLETGELEGVGHDAITVWVKVVAGWATFLLYFWTLVAPLVFPNREWA